MGESFQVRTSPRFDRLARKLIKKHPDFPEYFDKACALLAADPYGRSGQRYSSAVRRLENVEAGDGQYRVRMGRFRLRYDINGTVVELKYCGLRRESTYR